MSETVTKTKLAATSWMNKMLGTMLKPGGGAADQPLMPLLQSKKEAGDSRRLRLGNRKFKVGALAIDGDGQKVPVVAEKHYIQYGIAPTAKEGQRRVAVYHPLKRDLLTVDTSVELSMQKNGEWTTRRHETPDPKAWLRDDAFDALDVTDETLTRPGRYLKMGERHFCFADVEGWHKDTTKTDRQIVEQLPGRSGRVGAFRLLNADLSPGAEVRVVPVAGQVTADPFTAHAIERAQEGFADHQRAASGAAAMAAMGVGADVDLAIDVANDMAISTSAEQHQDLQGCGIAAAVAAEARRAGIEKDVARRAGQAIFAFRRVPPGDGGEHAEQGIASAPPSERARHVQDTATAVGQCLNDARTEQQNLDRSMAGASMNAIDGLARFLFEEKPGSAVSEAQAIARAKAGARHMVARTADAAKNFRDAAEAAIVRAAAIRDKSFSIKAEMRRVLDEIEAALEEQRKIGEKAATSIASERDLQPTLNRLRNKIGDLDAEYKRLEVDLQGQDTVLNQLSVAARQAVQHAREAQEAADAVRQANGSEAANAVMEAAARAMLAARSVAPDSPEAGKAAALAAANAIRSGADAEIASYSAATARLAVLAGAGPAEAEVAGLTAVHYRTHARRDELLAALQEAPTDAAAAGARNAVAQALIAGSVQPEGVAQSDLLPLAAAASVILSEAPAQAQAAATVLKSAPPSRHQNHVDVPQKVSKFFVQDRETLAVVEAELQTVLSKDKPVLLPPGYEPVGAVADGEAGEIEPGYEHTRMRVTSSIQQTTVPQQGSQKRYIEIETTGGSRAWVEYFPNSAANEMIGRIAVKPSGLPDTALGGQNYIQVAFNGYRREWAPLSSRTRDLDAILAQLNQEIDKLAVVRDSEWAMFTTPYRFENNPEGQSIVEDFKEQLTVLVTLYMRGRTSGTTYRNELARLKLHILDRLQQERSRKKALNRAALQLGISIVAGVIGLATSIGRLGIAAGGVVA